MLRKVLSTVLLVISGFFLYILVFMAFIQVPSFNIKLAMMGIFLIPMLLTLLLGLALRSFSRWQRICGIVFMCTAAWCAFLFLTIVCMLYSPELKLVIDQKAFALFSDIVSGVGFFALVLLSGAVLFYRENST